MSGQFRCVLCNSPHDERAEAKTVQGVLGLSHPRGAWLTADQLLCAAGGPRLPCGSSAASPCSHLLRWPGVDACEGCIRAQPLL